MVEYKWHPIETAPKDKVIDLFGCNTHMMMPRSRHTFCHWGFHQQGGNLFKQCWCTPEGGYLDDVTHWMPIPPDPTEEQT